MFSLLNVMITQHTQYLIVHGEDDHQFPEDGDEVEEQVHTVPSKNKRYDIV